MLDGRVTAGPLPQISTAGLPGAAAAPTAGAPIMISAPAAAVLATHVSEHRRLIGTSVGLVRNLSAPGSHPRVTSA